MVVLRYINLVLCLCLLPLSASSSVRYRTAELKRLSEVLQVQIDSIHEGENTISIGDRLVRIQLEEGMVSSMGYVLFPDELKAMAHTPILNFLERYFLQLDYPQADRPRNKMLHEDRFKFEVGSPTMVATLQADCAFSYSYENNRYIATWSRDGQPILSVSFPANHELISGENKIDAENFVETDIRVSQLSPAMPVNKELLTSTIQKDYFIKQGSTYISKQLTSSLYYQQIDSIFSLIINESHPLESAANMMLCADNPTAFNLKVKQVMYGYKKKYFDVPLRNWIAYCQNNGCELYFGVESFEKEMIRASVFAVNIAENYNHVLFVNIPLKVIDQGTGDIEAQLETFIPMHNVLNLFGKYDKNSFKQPKIYE